MDGMKTLQENEKQQRMVKGLADIKGDVVTPYVFFQAHTLKNTKLVSGDTFVFADVVIDVASAYNNQTGVFTPPHGGVYAFSVNLCIGAINSYMYIKVVSKEKTLFQTLLVSSTGSNYGCYSLQALAVLQTGETVVVKMGSTSMSGNVAWEYVEVWNSFSGVLLRVNNYKK